MSLGERVRLPQQKAQLEDGPESFRPALRRFFGRRIGDPAEIEDLVQEALLRLVAQGQGGEPRDPRAYVFRIAHNLLADRHRRGASMLRDASPLEESKLPPVACEQEQQAVLRDLQSLLDAALGELPPRTREVFILRRFRDMDTGQIAEAMGISRRMVQKHLGNALTHLYLRLAPTMENYL